MTPGKWKNKKRERSLHLNLWTGTQNLISRIENRIIVHALHYRLSVTDIHVSLSSTYRKKENLIDHLKAERQRKGKNYFGDQKRERLDSGLNSRAKQAAETNNPGRTYSPCIYTYITFCLYGYMFASAPHYFAQVKKIGKKKNSAEPRSEKREEQETRYSITY